MTDQNYTEIQENSDGTSEQLWKQNNLIEISTALGNFKQFQNICKTTRNHAYGGKITSKNKNANKCQHLPVSAGTVLNCPHMDNHRKVAFQYATESVDSSHWSHPRRSKHMTLTANLSNTLPSVCTNDRRLASNRTAIASSWRARSKIIPF